MGEYKINGTTKLGGLILIIFLSMSIMGLISLHYAPASIVILMFILMFAVSIWRGSFPYKLELMQLFGIDTLFCF